VQRLRGGSYNLQSSALDHSAILPGELQVNYNSLYTMQVMGFVYPTLTHVISTPAKPFRPHPINKSTMPYSEGIIYPDPRVCKTCGFMGAWRAKCPKCPCQFCHQPGHIITACSVAPPCAMCGDKAHENELGQCPQTPRLSPQTPLAPESPEESLSGPSLQMWDHLSPTNVDPLDPSTASRPTTESVDEANEPANRIKA
jgi:hypothetical protein